MAGLNLDKISERLNNEFDNSYERQLVFWYDENEDFIDLIENINLKNAKVWLLKEDELFKAKIHFEREDTKTNYLVYAPFKRPDDINNHLADTILYSKTFDANRVKLIMADLGIDEVYESELKKYNLFFNSEARTLAFSKCLKLSNECTIETIKVSLLSALVKKTTTNFDEIVRTLIMDDDFTKSKYLEEFAKYNLKDVFWQLIKSEFNYGVENKVNSPSEEEPNLLNLVISLFVTYAASKTNKELPDRFKPLILDKTGTVNTFVSQIMNDARYDAEFDKLAAIVFNNIEGENIFNTFKAENVIDLDIFEIADRIIIKWIIARLMDKSLNEMIDGKSIKEICSDRMNMNYAGVFKNEYNALIYAYDIIDLIEEVKEQLTNNCVELVKAYDTTYWKIDMSYRKFYYYLDKIANKNSYEELQDKIERSYFGEYLDKLDIEFNDSFDYGKLKYAYKLQTNFYKDFMKKSNEREIVIISDAMRYEVAKELVSRAKISPKMEAQIEPVLGVLPSITRLGMEALLPHDKLEIDDNYDFKVDGDTCYTLVDRQKKLQSADINNACIQFDEIKKYKQIEQREFFKGKNKVYIYHNQIDARGDASKTEDEVFDACEEAITEIIQFIGKVSNSTSITNFIITSDHGFIYRRSQMQEYDKIDKFYGKNDYTNRRFVLSDDATGYDVLGTVTKSLYEFGIVSNKKITYPKTSIVLKMPGGGMNFFHGGCSPQESIVPVISLKTVKGAVGTDTAKIKPSIIPLAKITSLKHSINFYQTKAVSEVVKPNTYNIWFVDKDDKAISDLQVLKADSKVKEEFTKVAFTFKDSKYSKDDKYYLIVKDMTSGLIIMRENISIDIAFANDFGFNV